MARKNLDMKSLFDIPLWEMVQDRLAEQTGLAIITIDYKGNPVTKHSARTDFCTQIRENPIYCKRCLRCDALAGLEAVRSGKPYIYLCHCDIVDAAVPVMVGDMYLGAVMLGQVRQKHVEGQPEALRLVNEFSSFRADGEDVQSNLLELYEKLPEKEYDEIVKITELVSSVVNYIVSRAVDSHNDLLEKEWLISTKEKGTPERHIDKVDTISPLKRHEVMPVPINSPVYPAVDYLNKNRHQLVSMNDMAELCHLSSSYFSRLFRRETGETFINYMNRQKVEWAKEMLVTTSLSVVNIATDLGYMDSSYFINVFKRFEGITPLAYRQYHQREN